MSERAPETYGDRLAVLDHREEDLERLEQRQEARAAQLMGWERELKGREEAWAHRRAAVIVFAAAQVAGWSALIWTAISLGREVVR